MEKFRQDILLFAAVLLSVLATSAYAVSPKVIKTIPENGDQNVDPGLRKIQIEFDQAMSQQGYSICGGGPKFPEVIGKPRWLNKKLLAASVRLKPNYEYEMSVNCPSYQNCKNSNGEPAEIYPIKFKTTTTGTKSTPSSKSPGLLLQEALYAEETEGNLDKAIEIYQQVIDAAGDTQKIAAQATYQLGMCYLKKGNREKAAEYFQQVVSNYPTQKVIVEKAREQLGKILPPEASEAVFGPRVVRTNPIAFANDVDPNLDRITVTFNTKMMDGSWSWTGGGDTYPQTTGKPFYDSENTTCSLPVKLQLGKVYWVGINSPSHRNFKNTERIPVPWYIILFATKNADGSATPIPQDMLARAKTINERVKIEKAEIKYAFGPVTEKIINDDGVGQDFMFDLDTGKSFSVSDAKKWSEASGVKFEKSPEDFIMDFIMKSGIDLVGETSKKSLMGIDMIVMPTHNERWDMSPEHAIEQVSMGKAGSPIPLSADGELPKTFVFKTGQGGMGILQITEMQAGKAPRHFKIRYKMLQKQSENWLHYQLSDNTALDLDSGAIISTSKDVPSEYDVGWDNDAGGVLMVNPKKSAHIIGLSGVKKGKQKEAIEAAEQSLELLRESPSRGVPAKQASFCAVLTDKGNLAVIEITEYSPEKAILKIWIKEEKAADILEEHKKRVADRRAELESDIRAVREMDKPKGVSVSAEDKRVGEDLSAEGWKLWGQRKLTEAEGKFKEAITKNPEAEGAYQGLGWVQLNQGKKLNAKDSFEKCIKLNPENSAALNGLGWIADGQGNIDEAVQWWQKAVEAQPGATASLAGLTKVYMDRKEYDKAIKYYEMWLKAEPDNTRAKEGLEKAKAEKSK